MGIIGEIVDVRSVRSVGRMGVGGKEKKQGILSSPVTYDLCRHIDANHPSFKVSQSR